MTDEIRRVKSQPIAFLLDNLAGGGAERVVLDMAGGFAALGYEVDLLVCEMRGELCGAIPQSVNVVLMPPVGKLTGLWAALRRAGREGLGGVLFWLMSARKIPHSFRYIPAISEYLQTKQPSVIYSNLRKSSINAVLAASAPGIHTRVFVGLQNAFSLRSEQGRRSGQGQMHSMLPILRYCLARAHGLIAASRGVADDAIAFFELESASVNVVYNPVTVAESAWDLMGPAPHPWFAEGAAPVILGIGRMVAQKNFPLLIRAFAVVREQVDARLIIVGGNTSSKDQMECQQKLRELAGQLGVGEDVALVGYQSNPHEYTSRARLFVLSSEYEGFGNVLVEALLAGCPVVSTDCPSGPAEILDDGQYGMLVPVNDTDRLSKAILASLASEPESGKLRQRGSEFSLERAVAGFHQLFFGGLPVSVAIEPGSFSPATTSSPALL